MFVSYPHPIRLVRFEGESQSRSQRPRSFWLATGIATSGQVQLRKSAIHGLPVILRMLRVKSDKSDWFWSRSIVFTKPFKTRMSLDLARGPNFSSACQKETPGDEVGGVRESRTYGVSSHAQKIGSGQRSRFFVLTKRSVVSGNENALLCENGRSLP